MKIAWANHQNVSDEFVKAVYELAVWIGIDVNWLMAAMAFETGPKARFLPTALNLAGSGALGLIQFMPLTLKGMGYTTDQVRAMSQIQQLQLVREYFAPYRGRLKTLNDVYMAILYPVAIGRPDDYVLFKEGTKAYRQNIGLDINKDGGVTKGEASAKVAETLKLGLSNSYAKVIEWT